MKKCPSCNTENENHFNYCSNCGSRFKAKRGRNSSSQEVDRSVEVNKFIEELRAGSFLLRNYRPITGALIALSTLLFLLFFYLIISYGLTFEDIVEYRHFDRGLLVIIMVSTTLLTSILTMLGYYTYCSKKLDPEANPLQYIAIFLIPLLFSPIPIGGFITPLIFAVLCSLPEKKSKEEDYSDRSLRSFYSKRYAINFSILPALIMLFIALTQGAVMLDIFFGNKVAHFAGIDTSIEWNGRLPLNQKKYTIVIRGHQFPPNTEIMPSGSCELIFEDSTFAEGSSIVAYGEAKVRIRWGRIKGTRVRGGDHSSLFIDELELEDAKVETTHNGLLTMQNCRLINSRLNFNDKSTVSLTQVEMSNGILKLEGSTKVNVDGLELQERETMYKQADKELYDRAMVVIEDRGELKAKQMYIIAEQRDALTCGNDSILLIEKGVVHSFVGNSLKGSEKALLMLADCRLTETLLKGNSILALDGSEADRIRVENSAYLIHRDSRLMRETEKGNYYEGRILALPLNEPPFDLAERLRAGELL